MLKGFGLTEAYLKKFRVLLHSELVFSHHWAFVAGFKLRVSTVCPLVFRKLNFIKSIFKKATCTNVEDNNNDIPDLQALLGPSVSGIQIQEVKFYSCCNFLNRDRDPRIFSARSATHYRFIVILKFSWLKKSLSRDRRET